MFSLSLPSISSDKWLTALALVFTFLTSLLLTAIPLAARWYIDHLVDPKEADSPVMNAFQFLILYYGLFIGRVLATYLSQLTFSRVSNSIVRDIRLDVFRNLQGLEQLTNILNKSVDKTRCKARGLPIEAEKGQNNCIGQHL